MPPFTRKPTVFPRNFRPQPGNFGALFNVLAAEIGTGGLPVVASSTVTLYVATPAGQTFSVTSAGFVGAIPAAGSAGITATLIRNNAGTPVTICAATSIKSDVITGDCADWPITANDTQRTCNPGDTLRIEIADAGTITTQPQLAASIVIAVQN
jgi:hypothetical protein